MNDDHLPAEGLECEICGEDTHVWCMETDLDIRWAGLFMALSDEVIRIERRAA